MSFIKDDWSSYVVLREGGSTPQELWNRSVAEGLNWAESVRMIRAVFGMTLPEAKEVKLRAEGKNMSLDEFQRDFILPAIEEAERQGLFYEDS